jgi:hypothetical protein
MSGIFISILVNNGSVTIKMIDNSATLPDIFDAVTRKVSHCPIFSRVHLRNDELVPVANALQPSAIKILPRVNIKNHQAYI